MLQTNRPQSAGTSSTADQLVTSRADCGCKNGMVALLCGLTLSTYWFFLHEPTSAHWLARAGYVFVVSLGCAVAGKIVGMFWRQIRRDRMNRLAAEEGVHVARGL